MKKINQKLYKDLQDHDLKKIEKESPEMLATLYAQLYEDGKTLIRIKEKTVAKDKAGLRQGDHIRALGRRIFLEAVAETDQAGAPFHR